MHLVRPTRKLCGLIFLGAIAAGSLPASAGDTFYVSPTGSDVNDGKTPETAWKSLGKVNTTAYAPGTQVLFERGGEWREQLRASSDGSADAPIVYGAYGSGAKPKFWGSDPLQNGAFAKLPGTSSTYQATMSPTVNSLFANHSFMTQASLKTGTNDPAVNRAYVDGTPNTWFQYQGRVYVNTGGANPAQSSTLYTAALREDLVYSNGKDNLVFRDLVVDESAKDDAGYAFRVQSSDNVTIENSEAYRAGKHHFGVINSKDFIGRGLYAAKAIPDQGTGGATAFVSFADGNQVTGANSSWIDCTAEDIGTYPAFFTHGTGMGDLLIQNMTAKGGPGIGISTEAAGQKVRIIGGHLDNSGIFIYGNDVLVDGVRITGADSLIDLRGNNNVIQNVLMTGTRPNSSYYSAIMDQGRGNVLQYNTVVLDPTSAPYAAALSVLQNWTDTHLVGNVFETPDAVLRQWFEGAGSVQSDFNLYSPQARVILMYAFASMEQWKEMGNDPNTLLTDPQFVNAVAGNYALAAGSPGVDYIDFAQILADGVNAPLYDFNGVARPMGAGFDAGAFEAVPEPGTMSLAVAAGALALLRRRARHSPISR
jgi:hypothetical protein